MRADAAWGWEKHSSVKLIGEDSNGRVHSLGCGKICIVAFKPVENQGEDGNYGNVGEKIGIVNETIKEGSRRVTISIIYFQVNSAVY